MKYFNNVALERMLGILFGVCVTLTILPAFQKLDEIVPLQAIALVVGILVLVGMGVLSWKRSNLQN